VNLRPFESFQGDEERPTSYLIFKKSYFLELYKKPVDKVNTKQLSQI